jgi:hypothetical protein
MERQQRHLGTVTQVHFAIDEDFMADSGRLLPPARLLALAQLSPRC